MSYTYTKEELEDAANQARMRLQTLDNRVAREGEADNLIKLYDGGVGLSDRGHNLILEKAASQATGADADAIKDVISLFEVVDMGNGQHSMPGMEDPEVMGALEEGYQQLGEEAPRVIEPPNKKIPYPEVTEEMKEELLDEIANYTGLEQQEIRKTHLISSFDKAMGAEERGHIAYELVQDYGWDIQDFEANGLPYKDLAPEIFRDMSSFIPDPNVMTEGEFPSDFPEGMTVSLLPEEEGFDPDIPLEEQLSRQMENIDEAEEAGEITEEEANEERLELEERQRRFDIMRRLQEDPIYSRVSQYSEEERKRRIVYLDNKIKAYENRDITAGITRQNVMWATVKNFNEWHGTDYTSHQQLVSDFINDRMTLEQENHFLEFERVGNSLIDRSNSSSSLNNDMMSIDDASSKANSGWTHTTNDNYFNKIIEGDQIAYTAAQNPNFTGIQTQRDSFRGAYIDYLSGLENELGQAGISMEGIPIPRSWEEFESILASGNYSNFSNAYMERFIGITYGEHLIHWESGGEPPRAFRNKLQIAMGIMQRLDEAEEEEDPTKQSQVEGAFNFLMGIAVGGRKRNDENVLGDVLRREGVSGELATMLELLFPVMGEEWGPGLSQASARSYANWIDNHQKEFYSLLLGVTRLSSVSDIDKVLHSTQSNAIQDLNLSMAWKIKGDYDPLDIEIPKFGTERQERIEALGATSLDEFVITMRSIGAIDPSLTWEETREELLRGIEGYLRLRLEDGTTESWIPKNITEEDAKLSYALRLLGKEEMVRNAFTSATIAAALWNQERGGGMNINNIMSLTDIMLHHRGITFMPGDWIESRKELDVILAPYTPTFDGTGWVGGTADNPDSGVATFDRWNKLPSYMNNGALQMTKDKIRTVLRRNFPEKGTFTDTMNRGDIDSMISFVLRNEIDPEKTMIDYHAECVEYLSQTWKSGNGIGNKFMIEKFQDWYSPQALGKRDQGLYMAFAPDTDPIDPSVIAGHRGNPRFVTSMSSRVIDDPGNFFLRAKGKRALGRTWIINDWTLADEDLKGVIVQPKKRKPYPHKYLIPGY